MKKVVFNINFGAFVKGAEVKLPIKEAEYYINMAIAVPITKDCGCGCGGSDCVEPEEKVIVKVE